MGVSSFQDGNDGNGWAALMLGLAVDVAAVF
jgi:hypothetical protein